MNTLEDNPSEKEMRVRAVDGKKQLEASRQSEEAKALQEAKGKPEVLEGQEASMQVVLVAEDAVGLLEPARLLEDSR